MLFLPVILCISFASMAIETPTFVTLSDDLQLETSDGERYQLAGVVRPQPYPAPDLFAEWVESLKGQAVTIESKSTDRYGAANVVAILQDGTTIQQMLLKQDAALAYSAQDLQTDWQTHPPAAAFIVQAGQAENYLGRYRAVRGTIQSATVKRNHAYLNFSDDWKSDFTIFIPKETLLSYSPESLKAMQGKEVLVRGLIHAYYGPRITLFNPKMLEILDDHQPQQ